MPSVFTLIINGDLPGHFIWSDEQCVAFLSINPITDGHALVVPRAEVDHWLDLDADAAAHLTTVGHHIGKAIEQVFAPERVGLMIAGFEVPHTHLHVLALTTMADMSFANAAAEVDHAELAQFADRLRSSLAAAGFGANAQPPS